ncbi:MAG TPA: hypothetical protein VHL10_01295 [Nitrososphaera sp.]|jgi:hypothetical protein|nr:hypothetical protein [Nitrososphaera sp.]
MKAGCKMDYLGMLGFSCIFLGCSMLVGLVAWLAHGWWIARKEREAAMQQENDEYAGDQQQVLPQHMDEYDGLHDALLRHVNEMIRKVDRQ